MTDGQKILHKNSRRNQGRLLRTVVLVGLMGSGKTAIGKRLASRLGANFADSDQLVEECVGMPVREIFRGRGEENFRILEREIICKALLQPPHVLATGGGAFMDPGVRQKTREYAAVLWLRADLDLLVARCEKNDNRPLLASRNPRQILDELISIRYPVYAQAEMIVDCEDRPHAETVEIVVQALLNRGVLRVGYP